MIPHCSTPARCSICIGATPRVVTTVAGATLVDGTPVAKDTRLLEYGKRGSEATRRKLPVKPAVRVRR